MQFTGDYGNLTPNERAIRRTKRENSMKIDSELLFTVSLDKELKNGNTGRNKHWSSAHRDKRAWMNALSDADIVTETGESFDFNTFYECVLGSDSISQKVGIVVLRVLGKRQRFWDSDSTLRGSKELIDSFVTSGILTDDNIKHVAWCVGLQDDSRKDEGPFTEVLFYDGETK